MSSFGPAGQRELPAPHGRRSSLLHAGAYFALEPLVPELFGGPPFPACQPNQCRGIGMVAERLLMFAGSMDKSR